MKLFTKWKYFVLTFVPSDPPFLYLPCWKRQIFGAKAEIPGRE